MAMRFFSLLLLMGILISTSGYSAPIPTGKTINTTHDQTVTKFGDNMFLGSDGTTYQRFGNVLKDSNGYTWQRFGNQIKRSDGKTCSIFGNSIKCTE